MSDYAKRRRKVREWLEVNGADALLVTSAANVRYLFGFAGEGMAVVGDGAVVSTDRRYEIEAGEIRGRVKTQVHRDGHLGGAAEALNTMKAKRVAFEAEAILFSTYESLQAKLDGAELVPSRKVVEQMRMVKDKGEIETITRAAAIMDKAVEALVAGLEEGVTEREAAMELEAKTLQGGADDMGFDTIFAFGPSAAYPHAVPGQRKLEPGHMIKIDCGAKVDGYCSDMTRTYIFGEPDDKLREVYQAVFDAQQAAVEAAGPGKPCKEIDAVARDIITERGYGNEFSHGLGHGVGLAVHEMPSLSARSEDTLKPGMVVTIEPGIYIEGWGGVRIEDSVAITRTGCERLTRAPKHQPDW